MKIKCHVEACQSTLVGEGRNSFDLIDRARARGLDWIGFLDASAGLSTAALCPEHSSPVKKAVELLISVFGEDFISMHLGFVAKHYLTEDKGANP